MLAIQSQRIIKLKSGPKVFNTYWNGISFGSIAVAKLYTTEEKLLKDIKTIRLPNMYTYGPLTTATVDKEYKTQNERR